MRLGELVTPMIDLMGARGPDSAGLALFQEPLDNGRRRFALQANDSFAWETLFDRLRDDLRDDLRGEADSQIEVQAAGNHRTLTTSMPTDEFRDWLSSSFPEVQLISAGRSIDVYKDEGHPREIAARYGFETFTGTHAVGHTRMATESAVSPAHAHPYTVGDFCLVHNGSLSNPYSVRRQLERRGIEFETDNDTEAGCRFLEWRMREGDTLEEAIERSFAELDGFFTFLMATADRLVLVRDAFACKPAVVAETDEYVAVSSEFRSLAHLPGIANANVFEPAPEQIYSWTV
jgi:amidophosphoribosyltransferase